MVANLTELVGRCPSGGHGIYRREDGEIVESCLCPGRLDGLFAASFGQPILLERRDHPTDPTLAGPIHAKVSDGPKE